MKTIIIAIIVAWLVFELVEHGVFPLVWLVKNRGKRSRCGVTGMIGKTVEVRRWDRDAGQVSINGELWRAECDVPLPVGGKAKIVHVEGLTLKLRVNASNGNRAE